MKPDYQHLEDSKLFELLSEDNDTAEKAFTELYGRYSPRVFAYCKRFMSTTEEAQDVFQDTFLKFLNSGKQAKETGKKVEKVLFYLLLIARHNCINIKRKEHVTYEFNDEIDIGYESHQDKDEMLNLIKVGLELIPTEYRELFVLREYDGLSYAEISELTNTPIANVKVKLHRSRQKLREVLAPYLEDLSKY